MDTKSFGTIRALLGLIVGNSGRETDGIGNFGLSGGSLLFGRLLLGGLFTCLGCGRRDFGRGDLASGLGSRCRSRSRSSGRRGRLSMGLVVAVADLVLLVFG